MTRRTELMVAIMPTIVGVAIVVVLMADPVIGFAR